MTPRLTPEQHDPIAFGKMTARRREAMGLSLRDIAGPLGLAVSTLHRMERGASCDIDTYLILAKWLKHPVPELPTFCSRCNGTGLENTK